MGKSLGIRSLNELNPSDLVDKTIFLRCDFNVPLILTKKGYRVLDDTRIRRFLDLTFKKIHYMTGGNCRIIIGSHLGRPHKKKDHMGWDGIFNIQFVSSHFDTLIRKEYGDTYTIFPPEIIDSHLMNSLEICFHHRLPQGGIKFLPNLRYLLDPRNPETYRREFIEELAAVADVYINCAFGCSHRLTKSIKMLPHIMRKKNKLVAAGELLHEEIYRLGQFGMKVLEDPKKSVVVAGGAKIADKIAVLKQFVESKIRAIFLGGRMVNAFLLAKDLKDKMATLSLEDIPRKMWESKNDDEKADLINEVKYADEIIKLAEKNKVTLAFPDDFKITREFKETSYEIKNAPDLSHEFQLDLGPKTIENYKKTILYDGEIKNIFWNGPLGAYDHPSCTHYADASIELAKLLFISTVSDENISVVIGGGDSAAILNKINLDEVKTMLSDCLKRQLQSHVDRDSVNLDFNGKDTYTLFNYFTSNFFVSTGGGAAMEFMEILLKDHGKADHASYLPGSAALMDPDSSPGNEKSLPKASGM